MECLTTVGNYFVDVLGYDFTMVIVGTSSLIYLPYAEEQSVLRDYVVSKYLQGTDLDAKVIGRSAESHEHIYE